MPDWDESSPRLFENLLEAAKTARDSAVRGDPPSLELARSWHRTAMAELEVPNKNWIGGFRGEQGLEEAFVRVGKQPGTNPSNVAAELGRFIRKLRSAISLVDDTLNERGVDTPEHLRLVLRTAAWAHAEWVRIHPFVNGNGRTARLWANWILMRFGIQPFVRLRPRPEGDEYARAGEEAMKGNWQPTLRAFESMMP